MLIAVLGCAFKADGMALAGWRLGQRYWTQGKRHIPENIWQLSALEPLINCKLASRKPDGIYVCGVEEFSEWLFGDAENGRKGGIKSAEERRKKYGSAQPMTRRQLEATRTGLKPPEPPFGKNVEAVEPPVREKRRSPNPPTLPPPLTQEFNSPLSPPKGGRGKRKNRVRQNASPCQACGGSGEVPFWREEERCVAACDVCRSKAGALWSIADAVASGWQLHANPSLTPGTAPGTASSTQPGE